MKWTDALRKTASVMLPWASKHDRRAAVGAARAEKERSRATAAQSRVVRQQIDRLARANGYADALADQVIRGRRDG